MLALRELHPAEIKIRDEELSSRLGNYRIRSNRYRHDLLKGFYITLCERCLPAAAAYVETKKHFDPTMPCEKCRICG